MTPVSWSLRVRLMASLGAATLVAWGASSLWLYRAAMGEADRLFDAALDHTAHAVLAVVRNEATELTESKDGVGFELAVIDQSDQNDIVYQVRGPNGRLVFRSHGAPAEPLAQPQDRGFADARVDGRDYRVFSLAIELNAAVIHVAQPVSRRIELARASAARLLAPGVALMLVLGLAVAWSVRRATEPVVRYARALDELAPESEQPADASGLPQELQSVARAIDRLLQRVHESLLHERTLTADAAHELRTPLAALRLQAQVARRAKDEGERDAALAELLAGVDRAGRMVDSVLTLARLDAAGGAHFTDQGVGVGRLAQLVSLEFAPLAAARGVRMEVQVDDSQVPGDEDALAIAMRNLISNALRYARERVRLAVDGDGTTVTVTVQDDGPGFGEESAKRAFHRFFRGSEEGRPSDGAGLGLALVLRIARLHGGTVSIVAGIDGGAGVALTLRRHLSPVAS